MSCVCGHDTAEHLNGDRCAGISYDPHYDSQFACVCPRYRAEQ